MTGLSLVPQPESPEYLVAATPAPEPAVADPAIPAIAPRPAPPAGDDVGPQFAASVAAEREALALQRLMAPPPGAETAPAAPTPVSAPAKASGKKDAPGWLGQAVGGVLDAIDDGAMFLESAMPLGGIDLATGKILSAEELKARPPESYQLGRLIDESDGSVGKGVRGVSQFLTGFIPLFRGLRAAGAGGAVSGTVAGALTDFTFVDAAQGNLANLWKDAGLPENDLTDLLAVKGDDSEVVGRIKNAAAGAGVGLALDGLIAGARIVRSLRRTQQEMPVETRVQLGATQDVMQERDFLMPGNPHGPRVTVAMQAANGGDPSSFLNAINQGMPGVANAGALPGRALNINLARIDTPDDVKATIAAVADVNRENITAATRGVMGFDTTRALASELGMTPETLLARRSGQAFSAEEALAARQVLAASADNLTSMAALVRTGQATDADVWRFQKALALHGEIQKQISGMTAEAGRALSAFRIPAGGDAVKMKALRETIDAAGGPQFAREVAERLATLDSVKGVNTMVEAAEKAKTSDMLMEGWINGLLSQPVTHVANIAGSVVTSLWQIPERFAAARIGQAMDSGPAGVAAGEATAIAYAMPRAMRDGLRLAFRAFLTGEPTDAVTKLETRKYRAITSENMGVRPESWLGAGIDLLGDMIRLPGQGLMVADEFFKAVNYRTELHARAFRQATAEGLEGPARQTRMQEIIDHPPDDVHLAAQDYARYQTFTKPLGEFGRGIQLAVNSKPAARVVLPFIRTPGNIFKYTLERTPLSPMMTQTQADIAAGGARRDLAIARIGLGTGVMAMAAEMAADGILTGGGPSNDTLKARLKETGWQPYSVRIGDEYYAYNRLEPLGGLIGLAADMADIAGYAENDSETQSVLVAGLGAFAKSVTSKTFMRGLSELIETIENPDARAEGYLARMAGTLVPGTIAGQARRDDPVMRDTKQTGGDPELDFAYTVLNQVKSRIPGLSETLPPRRDLWGEPIEYQGALGPDIMSPIYRSRDKKDPVADEVMRLRLDMQMPGRTIKDVEMTPEEYDRFTEIAGKGARDGVARLIQSPGYAALGDGPDGGKALQIRKLVSVYRESAQAQVLTEFPGLLDAIKARQIDAARKLRMQE